MPTEKKKVTRKLSAILSADVKGYSVLMADDEVHTIETLKSHRQIISDLIVDHSGRVVDSPGDNILAEFRSVVDAVQCAIDIQNRIKKENDRFTEDKRVQFRIGVNIGDVIQDGERIYGNGVNVAARIEGIADTGGVCISRNAYDHIKNKLNFGYEYLGEHEVKNIKDPIRVYRVLLDPSDAGKRIGEKPNRFQNKWPGLAVATVAILIGIIAWQFYYEKSPPIEAASVERMAYPLPDNPSIVVLPFTNMSNDPDQQYFCDGITEDIITALSNAPDLFVIARDSSFAYKNKAVKVKEVVEDLGVRYVLEGSVRKSEGRIRVTVKLIDAITGKYLWTDQYDRELKETFTVQDEITFKIFDELQVELNEVGDIRTCARGTDDINAYLIFLQGLSFIHRETVEDNAVAKTKFEEATALDVEYSSAYALMGFTYMFDVLLGSSKSPEQSFAKASELILKSLALDHTCPAPYVALTDFYLFTKQHDKAINAAEQGITHNPNNSMAIQSLGVALIYADRLDEGIIHLKKAIRLNPKPPWYFLGQLGNAYMLKENYEDALVEIKKVISLMPTHIPTQLSMAVCYSALGRMEEARATIDTVHKLNPNFTLYHFAETYGAAVKNTARLEKMLNLLRKAGFSEHPTTSLPEKPSIAVLPFDNMTGDPDQNYFCDGFTEHIISTLSYVPELLVISRRSTFAYKDISLNVQQIGAELGADWIIEGSVQKSDQRIRITVQLIEATTGHHRWSETYDREFDDIFKLQDDIAFRILKEMQIELTSGEGFRNVYAGISSVDEYKKALKISEFLYKDYTLEGLKRAEQEIHDFIKMNPDIPATHTLLAGIYVQYIWQDNCESIEICTGKASESIKKAIRINEDYAPAYVVLGQLSMMMREYEKAKAAVKKAMLINPSNADAYSIYGEILFCQSQFNEAVVQIEKAIRLDPLPNWYYYLNLGQNYQYIKSYPKAIEYYNKSIELYPNHWGNYAGLVVSYSMLGDMEKANIAKSKLLSFRPDFTISHMLKTSPLENKEAREIMIEGFRKAGLPE